MMNKNTASAPYILCLVMLGLAVSGCQQEKTSIVIDGSSTVYPISNAIADKYTEENPGAEIMVDYTSTGAGFKKFIAGETQISNASRPIKEKEAATAKENGIEYIELPVAYDGISVVVNPANNWVTDLTVEELKLIFSKESGVANWSDVREEWPATPITIFAPDTASGTYDYFCSVITGKDNHTRDYTGNEDDNVLINGVSSNEGSIGYFGFSYYIENQDLVKAVAVDSGAGPVAPSIESIADGSYAPLSRPIFIYVSKSAAESSAGLSSFVDFYLMNANEVVKESGYIPLPNEAYAAAMQRFKNLETGSPFSAAEAAGKPVLEVLKGN